MADHSAAGSAAGFHFQVQRALLDLLACEDADDAISIENLDDLDITNADEIVALEQLKHSINPGSLTDARRQWWEALALWMDLVDKGRLARVKRLVLVTTLTAPEGSAAALLGDDDGRNPEAATELLLGVASTSEQTREAREAFAALDPAVRLGLVGRIVVRDAQDGIGNFHPGLRAQLKLALPRHGSDDFIRQVVGWWEERAVDLMLRRRDRISLGETQAEIARIRDGYTPATLPDPDVADFDLDAVLTGYKNRAFFHQLDFIRLRAPRVERAIVDYHRAFVQRSRWLENGVLGPGELRRWEDKLVDEWDHAWDVMIDEVEHEPEEDVLADRGHRLYDRLQESDRHPLRSADQPFLKRGTLHGLADARRVGWHRDFAQRLDAVLGSLTTAPATDTAFEAFKARGESPE